MACSILLPKHPINSQRRFPTMWESFLVACRVGKVWPEEVKSKEENFRKWQERGNYDEVSFSSPFFLSLFPSMMSVLFSLFQRLNPLTVDQFNQLMLLSSSVHHLHPLFIICTNYFWVTLFFTCRTSPSDGKPVSWPVSRLDRRSVSQSTSQQYSQPLTWLRYHKHTGVLVDPPR